MHLGPDTQHLREVMPDHVSTINAQFIARGFVDARDGPARRAGTGADNRARRRSDDPDGLEQQGQYRTSAPVPQPPPPFSDRGQLSHDTTSLFA